MKESLREIAIDMFERGQDEVVSHLQTVLARVLERVMHPEEIEFQKRGNAWYAIIDDVKFRLRHDKALGWITEVWSPEAEWVQFGSLSDLGGVLSREAT